VYKIFVPKSNQFNWYSENLDSFEAFLDTAGTAPFFMWIGFTDPHRPYEKDIIDNPQSADRVYVPPYLNDDLATRDDLAEYYNEIRRMDTQIGSYLKILRKRNLTDNTLILFFSDNGAPFPRAKGALYDSGIKTPLIFAWPAVIQKGIVYEPLVSVIDLAPTLLEIAGLQISSAMQGTSIFPALKDPSLPGRTFLFSERNWHNCDEHMRSIRSKRYKLISNAYTELPFGSPSDISSSPSWKSLHALKNANQLNQSQSQIFQMPRPAWELYDLQSDPYEFTNLAAEPAYQDILKTLRNELERWRRETNDFSADERRRADNTDRFTGLKFDQTLLPARPAQSD
jgi:arylsulfatase A-like enzyme